MAACAAGAVLWAGNRLTEPARAGTGLPDPALGARSLRFPSASGAALSAWFIPGSANAGAVLLLHGVRSNKRAMLPRARFLRALGFSLLLVDLQAHGESGGEQISFGHREAADVSAAVRKLRELAPGERIGVLGTSLGAAAIAFSDVHPLLSAAVLESLYPSIEEAVANRLRIRFGPAGPWLAPLLLVQLNPRLGVSAEQLRPVDRVGLLGCPMLLVHGSEDRHTTIEEAERIFDRIRAPKELHVVQGAGHSDLHAQGGKGYERRVGEFLVRHLRSASQNAPQ
ncbi:MAG: alpha/beta hydrolase [Betaproteobacteria bacterium]|nr:MAG: alpha/beta hydrolase [Betaproteobacteria bacterium]